MILNDIITSFILGLLTPLTAVCVIPLYPGFISYLANQFSQDGKASKKHLVLTGLLVLLGVVVFMLLFGFIFTTVLQVSLTKVIGIVSPIAFALLGLVSLLMIFNVDFGKYLPKFTGPQSKNPLKQSFGFGFFFGAVVLPCNPLFIAALFTRVLSTADFARNMVNFLSFGAGIGFPLLVLAVISSVASQKIISILLKCKRHINLVSGLIMLGVSIYYIFFVFRVFG